MTARRGAYPRAHQEQQGRQKRGEDGQGQGPHEGSWRRPDGRQEPEEGRPLGPEEGQGQGEEGQSQRPPELVLVCGAKCPYLWGIPGKTLRALPSKSLCLMRPAALAVFGRSA